MADSCTFSTEWKRLYEMAMLETDPTKLSDRIADAYLAILERTAELIAFPASEEHKALSGALRFLQILENEISENRISAAD
jgi:hypothetical protein